MREKKVTGRAVAFGEIIARDIRIFSLFSSPVRAKNNSYDERNKEQKNNVFSTGHHFSEDPMRMRFNRASGVGYLTLRPVAVSDQGIYRCRVDYKEARTTNFYVNLSVISK
jgi:hypothetical protein